MSNRNATEPPTARRLQRARREGDHPVGRQLVGVLSLAAGLALLPVVAASAIRETQSLLSIALAHAAAESPPIAELSELPGRVLFACLPVLGASALAAWAIGLWQTGGVVSFHPVRWDTRRLSPFGRSPDNPLGGAATRVAGVCFLLVAAYVVVDSRLRALGPQLFAASKDTETAFAVARQAMHSTVLWLLPALLAWAVLDALMTRRLWLLRLRMTRDEKLREQRENERNPRLDDESRRAARELSRAAERERLAGADVLITDGQRLAAALRYLPTSGAAPEVVVLASGTRGAQLVATAVSLGTPIFEDPTLARELAWLSLGDEIPPSLYAQVADALRDVGAAAHAGTAGKTRD